MSRSHKGEGMRIARLLMVLSSISPLFILWGIRGNDLVPDSIFLSVCACMVLLPNLFLWLRIQTVKSLNEKRELLIGSAEDHREHLLVYLFAMLLPFYGADLASFRDLMAVLAALGFIVFLFWHLNLHYMNLLFAIFGYRVFTVNPPQDGNLLTGKTSWIVITRRISLESVEKIFAYRLSDTVYMEVEE